MAIELRQITAGDVEELGRICYEAFTDIATKHGFESDFASADVGRQVVGMLVQQEDDVYSVGAFDDGAPRGSNFIEMWDEVAGLGPISVDIASQGKAIGRRLMMEGVAEARRRGHERVRLCQDAFNMHSLGLYASVGFDTKEPLAFMSLSAEGAVDPAFRPATMDDLGAMDDLCQSVFGFSRKGECAQLMTLGFPAFVLDRGGVVAYLLGTLLGHGVAQANDDMVALLAGVGARVPDAASFVPLRNADLYRRALAAGHRNKKVMNLMAFGPYDEPRGVYCPSVLIG